MIFALTFILKQLVPDVIALGVAGAIIGTSEFADAAGFAVAAELATRFGESPIHTFTLMKVIGRDIWIGIRCLILAFVSVMFWEKDKEGKKSTLGASIIWERFPKFVLGFLTASIIVSVVSTMAPPDYTGKAAWEGMFKGKEYKADFPGFQPPPEFADRLTIDKAKKALAIKGPLSGDELKTLTGKYDQPGSNPGIEPACRQFKLV